MKRNEFIIAVGNRTATPPQQSTPRAGALRLVFGLAMLGRLLSASVNRGASKSNFLSGMRTSLPLVAMLLASVELSLGAAQDNTGFSINSVHVGAGGDTIAVKFDSETGKTYHVESSPTLGSGLWSETEISATGTDGELTVSLATAGLGKLRFFRVRAVAAAPIPGFFLIPAGSFQMGDGFAEVNSDELPVHTVHVSGFWLQAKETTKAEWDEVRAWGRNHGYTDLSFGGGKAADHPVHSVSWYDVVKWCNARSEMEGLTPCYYTDGARTLVYRTGQVNLSTDRVQWDAAGYRLPTEAEWEKAARGGLEGRRFPWGDTITHSMANYSSFPDYPYDENLSKGFHPDYESGDRPFTAPVGSFSPNGYGLYDMAGNVIEWCWDLYSATYYESYPEADPLGPASGPNSRIHRGGSWLNYPPGNRVTFRHGRPPFASLNFIGFRPALRQE